MNTKRSLVGVFEIWSAAEASCCRPLSISDRPKRCVRSIKMIDDPDIHDCQLWFAFKHASFAIEGAPPTFEIFSTVSAQTHWRPPRGKTSRPKLSRVSQHNVGRGRYGHYVYRFSSICFTGSISLDTCRSVDVGNLSALYLTRRGQPRSSSSSTKATTYFDSKTLLVHAPA